LSLFTRVNHDARFKQPNDYDTPVVTVRQASFLIFTVRKLSHLE